MTGREILEALKCGRPSCACAKGRVTHCPSHEDANPSLSISEVDGKALLKCHAGCSQSDLIAALKARDLWTTSEQQTARPIPIRSGRGQLTRTYEFRDASGTLIAEHGRFDQAGGGKSFAWRVPGGDWRDGLGTVAIADLPLYGLDRVLTAPESPVWIVEGEKAAEACWDAGLVAVALGGGANQQSFGNTLDVLRDRDVILWPDNDEPGFAFMARLAGLLPQARYVKPIVPAKGDAFDYFAAGGNLEGLNALLEANEPRVEMLAHDAMTVTMPVPAGRVVFTFSDIFSLSREVNCEMRIAVDVPGKRRTPFSRRINLESSSGLTGVRRELQDVYPGKDIDWAVVLSEATDIAKETWRGIDRSIDLADVALPETREWAVERFAPKGLSTILFGTGGGGKSYLCADILLHCLYGMPWKGRAVEHVFGVLVIDYEDAQEEWRLRVQQLCDGYGWPFPDRGYRYLPGSAIPIADQISTIRDIVEREQIGIVVVDSAISAVGGDVIDTKSPARLINALQTVGVTSIIIAHNTKADDSRYPIGSVMWHNLVRATHYIESSQEEGSLLLEAAVYNRKGNRGLQKPIALRFTFPETDAGPVTIDLTASIPESLRSEEQTGLQRVKDELFKAGTAITAANLAERTAVSSANVRAYLSKGKGKWCDSNARGLWFALSQREDYG